MSNAKKRMQRAGVTLIEMLVALVILAILVAAVFPVITAQVEDAEPTRAASDLASLRTAIELFHLNIRPTYPGDIEDLAVAITVADAGVDAVAFADPKDTQRWKGPYVDATVTSTVPTDNVITTGYSGRIQNDLVLFDVDASTANGGEAEDQTATTAIFPDDADFVALRINNLSESEFEQINDLIDGDEVDGNAAITDSQNAGRFRYIDPAGAGGLRTTAYYLTVPYRQ